MSCRRGLLIATVLVVSAVMSHAKDPPVPPTIRIVAAPPGVRAPTTTTLDREQLIEPHKLELPELLDLTPGLNVRVGGRGEPRVDMRGFDQRSTLLLLDGVPVTDPWNGIVNVNLFPIEMLGGVQITRGPVSSLLGPNALAGAIELSTIRGVEGVAGSLGTQWRDSRTWDVRASASAGNDELTGVVGGRYLTSSGFPLAAGFDGRPASRRRWDDGGLRSNSDREQWSAFGSGRYEWSERGGARLVVLGSDAEFGVPPTTTAFLPPFRRTDAQRLFVVQGGVDHAFDWGALEAAIFYDRYESRESTFDGADFAHVLLSTRIDSDEVGGLARLRSAVTEEIHLGGSAQVRHARANVSDSANMDLGAPDVTLVSLGLEGEYRPWSWLTFVIGLSGDVQAGSERGTEGDPNPLGAVSVDLGAFGAVSVLAGCRTRFPTLRELFDPLQGNADLGAEQALTYQIAYRYDRDAYFGELALYRSDVDDLIEQEGSSVGTRFVNLRDARLQGVETALGGAPFEWLDAVVNYTYLDARARNERTGDLTPIQHRPEHRLNGVLNAYFPYDFRLRLEGLYGSGQIDRFGGTLKTDSFGLFNAQLAWTAGDAVVFYAGADNLLDDDYEERLGSPQPGRWVYLGFRASLREEWFA